MRPTFLAGMRRSVRAMAVLALGSTSLLGCGANGSDGQAPTRSADASDTSAPSSTSAALPARRVELTAGDVFFEPRVLELQAGERVDLVVANTGAMDHNLTIMDLDVHQQLDHGTTEHVVIAPPAGTYPYLCGYHTKMRGTLRVL